LNGRASVQIDEGCAVLVRQASRPLLKTKFGQFRALRMGIHQGDAEVFPATAIQLVADGVRNELAPVLLPTVDILNKIVGKSNCHSFDTGHFIPLV